MGTLIATQVILATLFLIVMQISAATEAVKDAPSSVQNQVDALIKTYQLELEDSRRDAILLLGRTGVGKSTLAEILFGDLASLKSTFDETLRCYDVEKSGEKKSSMFESDTIRPHLFKDADRAGLAIYDCPGFADTRGKSNEIATGVYLGDIVEHAERVKLVVVTDFDTIKPKANRREFTNEILLEVLDLVLSNDIYEGGVFLLVNKYDNSAEKNNNPTDDDVVSGIAEFLKLAQQHAVEFADDNKAKSINALFDNSWLKTVDGKYPNIGFSKYINEGGKVSNMDHLTRRNELREQILDNPHFQFKSSDRKHFGCPISNDAKLDIRRIQNALGNQVKVHLQAVGQKVKNKFVESTNNHKQMSTFSQQYASFLSDMKQMTTEESGLTLKSLETLGKFGNNINEDIEIEKLEDAVKTIKFLSRVDVEESSTTWKDAHGNWNEAITSMKKDLLTEFRKAQRSMVVEIDQFVNSVRQRIVAYFETAINVSFFTYSNSNLWDFMSEHNFSNINKMVGLLLEQTAKLDITWLSVWSEFDRCYVFLNDIKRLKKRDSGLSEKSLRIIKKYGGTIGVDFANVVDKLTEIMSSLKYLTELDEEDVMTSLEVERNWNNAMQNLEKDIDHLKAEAETTSDHQKAAGIAAAILIKFAETAYSVASSSEGRESIMHWAKTIVELGIH